MRRSTCTFSFRYSPFTKSTLFLAASGGREQGVREQDVREQHIRKLDVIEQPVRAGRQRERHKAERVKHNAKQVAALNITVRISGWNGKWLKIHIHTHQHNYFVRSKLPYFFLWDLWDFSAPSPSRRGTGRNTAACTGPCPCTETTYTRVQHVQAHMYGKLSWLNLLHQWLCYWRVAAKHQGAVNHLFDSITRPFQRVAKTSQLAKLCFLVF